MIMEVEVEIDCRNSLAGATWAYVDVNAQVA